MALLTQDPATFRPLVVTACGREFHAIYYPISGARPQDRIKREADALVEQFRRCSATVIDHDPDRRPLDGHCVLTWEGSLMRVESPETGLRNLNLCCGGQH